MKSSNKKKRQKPSKKNNKRSRDIELVNDMPRKGNLDFNINPINFAQSQYMEAIHNNAVVFGIGSAGTGKTFISTVYAAKELYHRNIDKVIITRPNIEVGKGLGFLPGELEQKYAPYLAPFEAIFRDYLGNGVYQCALKSSAIEPRPLGFMRGANFEDSIILFDEAQNATKEEFEMILSRIGKNCKMIISGDSRQADIRNSGLTDAVNRLSSVSNIEVINFLPQDIVRSELCKSIIMAYST